MKEESERSLLLFLSLSLFIPEVEKQHLSHDLPSIHVAFSSDISERLS